MKRVIAPSHIRSAYLIMQLLEQGEEVQPIHILFLDQDSLPYSIQDMMDEENIHPQHHREITTIKKLIPKLRKIGKGILHDCEFVDIRHIETNNSHIFEDMVKEYDEIERISKIKYLEKAAKEENGYLNKLFFFLENVYNHDSYWVTCFAKDNADTDLHKIFKENKFNGVLNKAKVPNINLTRKEIVKLCKNDYFKMKILHETICCTSRDFKYSDKLKGKMGCEKCHACKKRRESHIDIIRNLDKILKKY